MPDVVRSIDIAATPSVVWQWLATPEALRAWMAPELEIDLRPGGAYRMVGADGDTTVSGTVLDVVPQDRLVLSWSEEGAGWLCPARLVITLEPIRTGTRVTLTHEGLAGIGSPRWRDIEQAYERGADRHRLLDHLAQLVDSGRVVA